MVRPIESYTVDVIAITKDGEEVFIELPNSIYESIDKFLTVWEYTGGK